MDIVKTAIAKLSEGDVRIAHHHDVLLENCEKLVEHQAEIISVYNQKVGRTTYDRVHGKPDRD